MFEPKNVVYEAAAVVAEERGLPAGWLDDAVKDFLTGDDPAATPVLDLPGLRCVERAHEILAVAEETFGDRIDPAARFFVEEIFSSQ